MVEYGKDWVEVPLKVPSLDVEQLGQLRGTTGILYWVDNEAKVEKRLPVTGIPVGTGSKLRDCPLRFGLSYNIDRKSFDVTLVV